MTIKIFRMFSEGSPIPLTVFASSQEDAKLTYLEWVVIHQPHRPAWSKEPSRVWRLSKKELAARPQLADAARAAARHGLDSVGYWLGHDRGWIALPTYCDRAGKISPYEPDVRYYLVEAEAGDDAQVFARDMDEALRLYDIWYRDAYGYHAADCTVRAVSRELLTGDQATLREDMDRGLTGIAGWTLAGGWKIYPPDHELAGE